MKIVVGNKKFSSWSLRPWLALKLTGAAFEETVIGLDLPDTAAKIREHSPSGRVPALVDAAASQSGGGSLTIWDSLAICEYLNEKFPQAQLWPADAAQRARARSVSAEMHAGFMNLRNDCSMKIAEEKPDAAALRPETQAEVDRIVEIWSECLKASGGPFLFGKKPCIADCFYAPVVSRFRTYKIAAPPAVRPYMDAVWAWPALQEWVSGARAETLRAKAHED
jgi:glutathione S-transferase